MYFYSQSTGVLQRQVGNTLSVVGKGYAGGNCGKNPEGVNEPGAQQIHCVGPLPQGLYTIGVPGDHIGPCSMPLTPDAENEMFGRAGFYFHGDNPEMNQSASEGCIVVGPAIRRAIAADLAADDRLTVTA